MKWKKRALALAAFTQLGLTAIVPLKEEPLGNYNSGWYRFVVDDSDYYLTTVTMQKRCNDCKEFSYMEFIFEDEFEVKPSISTGMIGVDKGVSNGYPTYNISLMPERLTRLRPCADGGDIASLHFFFADGSIVYLPDATIMPTT
jgi:hypothetical protein